MTELELFTAAVQIEDMNRRLAYMNEACAGQPELQQRVDVLLRAYDQAGDFLQRPPDGLSSVEYLEEAPGAMIGPYKFVERIGEGGFGVVYRAEQLEPLRRTVALKVLKPGMDSRQVVARFEAERQALAIMDHPNIAKVIDAGTTPSGRPFFVMELVQGTPITEYCDAKHLTPEQRLRLFIDVCQAVQHAHRKGIIHRDIKPSNVMLTEQDGTPMPKVIDFGVAKAVGREKADPALSVVQGEMIGTPLYMAPEQADRHGHDVDTRTDVYGLGVLLYELLTGTTPFPKDRFQRAAGDEICRIIREEEPHKPSTRLSESTDALPSISALRNTEPAKLTRLVRGELDWIVMKALEKERDRRYDSAAGLAHDVQRYLADEPVQAGPPTASYRLRKFVRRHKAAVAAALAFLLTLAGGIVGTTWGLVRANDARKAAQTKETEAVEAAGAATKAQQAAEASAAETRAVLEFVENKIFAAARPKDEAGGLGKDVSLGTAIEAAVSSIDQSFAEQPLVEAQLRKTLGTSFWYLGETKKAAEQYEKALQLNQKHRGPAHRETMWSSHNLALSYSRLGRRADALKIYEETLTALREKLGPDHHETLHCATSLADCLYSMRRFADALRIQEDTLPRVFATLGAEHPDTLMSRNNLANTYGALGQDEKALKLHQELLTLFMERRGPDNTDTLSSMTSLASTLERLGRHDEALKLRQDVLARRTDKLGINHDETLKAMNNLAASYSSLNRHEDALKLHKEIFEVRKVRLGPDNDYTLRSMHSVALSLIKLERGAEAIPIIDECVRLAVGKEVDSRLIPWDMDNRLRHFEKAKDAGGCRATADIWEKLNRTDAESLYTAAIMRAVTAAAIRQDATIPAADVERLANEQADVAMAWLKKAKEAGFSDLSRLKTDKSLDALRAREDFRRLVTD